MLEPRGPGYQLLGLESAAVLRGTLAQPKGIALIIQKPFPFFSLLLCNKVPLSLTHDLFVWQ